MGYFYIMELKYTDGCTCTSLEIDGKESVDLTLDEFKKVIHKIVDNITDFAQLQSIFTEYLELEGDYTDLGHCDCCGDHICMYSKVLE